MSNSRSHFWPTGPLQVQVTMKHGAPLHVIPGQLTVIIFMISGVCPYAGGAVLQIDEIAGCPVHPKEHYIYELSFCALCRITNNWTLHQ
jgi:hypothetical protein